MKKQRIFAAILLCVMLASALLTFAACASGDEVDELVVYNWADYIYPEYQEEFEAYYEELTGRKINLTYVTFDTNETMLTKIMKGDSIVDIMCPSEYAIQKLLQQDLLVPLNYFDESKYIDAGKLNDYVHNSGNVDENVVDKIAEGFGSVTKADGSTANMIDYIVPYMYGTLGILYNKMYFEEIGLYDSDIMNAANWGLLFNDDGSGNVLDERLSGRIYMKDSVRDGYAATVFYLAESGKLNSFINDDTTGTDLINLTNAEVIELCRQALVQQKQHLYGYEVDFGKNELLKSVEYVMDENKLDSTYPVIDLAWSGDAIYAVEESWNDDYGEEGDYALSYYVPHGAGNIWFDGWVIPKTCRHEEAARIFINFLNSPYVAASNMMEIGYSSAVSPEAVLEDEEAMAVLYEGYNVCAPDFWQPEEADWQYDYETTDEFVDYFFNYNDEIDGSNWRYPFAENSSDFDRGISTLGVMHDFGESNTAVVTMWEGVRSTGVTALPLLGWTLLVVAVVVGAVALVNMLVKRRRMYVKVEK